MFSHVGVDGFNRKRGTLLDGPQELQGLMPTASGQCMADEKQCGNNECVKVFSSTFAVYSPNFSLTMSVMASPTAVTVQTRPTARPSAPASPMSSNAATSAASRRCGSVTETTTAETAPTSRTAVCFLPILIFPARQIAVNLRRWSVIETFVLTAPTNAKTSGCGRFQPVRCGCPGERESFC